VEKNIVETDTRVHCKLDTKDYKDSHNMQYLLYFHYNDGCTKAFQCYVSVHGRSCFSAHSPRPSLMQLVNYSVTRRGSGG